MKPTDLKPGARVIIESHGGRDVVVGTFIRRVSRQPNRPAHSIIRVDDFAGLHGSDDLGDTPYPDYVVSRRVYPQPEKK
ncbi:hypothetical protein [Limnobaculum xujianqingii]|uniref:hypothetical protein n=1 Tax=Limnobaculum xujianqingii TaxID=2738837 RepID=UPI00112EF7CF|nr:hypothetical protein [Limnobaculum xujianqingii]